MRTRPVVVLALVVAGLAACAPAPTGPSAPIALEQVRDVPALDASAARQTVVDFVEAYAASPIAGPGPLVGLVAGPDLGAWVRWLAVQHREFTGSISGAADVRDVEYVAAIEAERATGAQVALSATVTFSYDPVEGESFERSRILDGPVTLLRTNAGNFRVVDLVRDGVPMSDGIQLFKKETRSRGGVTVTVDSLFMFQPNWQFNIEIANRSGHPLAVDTAASGLFVRSHGNVEPSPSASTPSLETIGARTRVDGILAFPIQDAATGRTLSLAYRGGGRLLRFAFPLDGLVDVVPPPPPDAATGATGATAATGATRPSGSTG
jgi:hypothetical protein